MLLHYLIVGLGGALGAMARHGVGSLVLRTAGDGFPWGTLLINVLGSFLIGVFVGILALVGQWSQEIRLFAVVGVLGGFTTFSAFSLESVLLFEKGQIGAALLYVTGSVLGSVLATLLGLYLVRAVTV
jgi:CrcB protein